jgi:hypothetical protein
MDSNDKFWVAVCGIAAVAVVVLLLGVMVYEHAFTKAAIEAGLVQGSLPGHAGVYWVKP